MFQCMIFQPFDSYRTQFRGQAQAFDAPLLRRCGKDLGFKIPQTVEIRVNRRSVFFLGISCYDLWNPILTVGYEAYRKRLQRVNT